MGEEPAFRAVGAPPGLCSDRSAKFARFPAVLNRPPESGIFCRQSVPGIGHRQQYRKVHADTQAVRRRQRAIPVCPAAYPDVVVRLIFGNQGAFAGGHMFTGSFSSALGVRFSSADCTEIGAKEMTVPIGPAKRPMREYVGLPEIRQHGDARPSPVKFPASLSGC